ncbi:MAG: Fic family protein [Candidatus Nanohaloarchaea archaeon]|nr:Fic family protein [Candidatus Nanohaloarchaea archaeon]
MDKKEFTEDTRGKLVDEPGDNDRKAFVPGPIPDLNEIEITVDILNKSLEAQGAAKKLSGIGRDMKDPSLLMTPYLRREALSSSEIEGAHTSLEKVLKAEAGESRDRDTKEVQNYSSTLKRALKDAENSKIDIEFIKNMHSRLFSDIDGAPGPIGEFRDTQNYIGHRYTPPTPEHVNGLMEDLIDYIRKEDETPPLLKIALSHYQFEAIHPFTDGNGRIGRMLIVVLLQDMEIMDVPLLYLSEFFNVNRTGYMYYLHRINTHGNYEDWINFFLTGVIKQSKAAIGKAEDLRALREEYRETIEASSQNAYRLIDLLFSNPYITKPMVTEKLDLLYQTASNNVNKLVNAGILEHVESGRINTYIAPKIIEIIEATPENRLNVNTP